MNELKLLEQIKEKINSGFGFVQMCESLGVSIDELKECAKVEHGIFNAIFDRFGIDLYAFQSEVIHKQEELKPIENIKEIENENKIVDKLSTGKTESITIKEKNKRKKGYKKEK